MIEFHKVRKAISGYYLEHDQLPKLVVVGRNYHKYLVKALDNYENAEDFHLTKKGTLHYAGVKIRPSSNVRDSDVILVDKGV